MKVKNEIKEQYGGLPFMTKDELLDEVVYLKLRLKVSEAQAEWLDRLADHERDYANGSSSEGVDESKAEVDELYREYKLSQSSMGKKLI